MALANKSLFLYGYKIDELNSSIDFKAMSGGPTLLGTLRLGFYSLSGLSLEISRALQTADPDNTYTVTANRNIAGGTENRVTIATSGSFLSLLFGSGPRIASSIAPLIGFLPVDRTGATAYTGSSTTGIILRPELRGYTYLSPDFNQKVFGSVNVSASGIKEAIVFNIQKFWQVKFDFEPNKSPDFKVITQWTPFLQWAMSQKPLEFTPDVTDPNTVFDGTLEKSSADGKGLGFMLTEMLPNHPNLYSTGLMTFRQTNT